jgi:phospholipase/carboxylesterase
MSRSFTLTHRYLPSPRATADSKSPLLIMLHGYGSNEEDLFGLSAYLDDRFSIISVRAPYALAPDAFAWFQIEFTPVGISMDEQQIELSRQRLVKFVGECIGAYPIDPTRVYLMGFSQGAMMSEFIALTQPDLIAGAVLMSGRTVPQTKPLLASREKLARMPIICVHGTHDEVLPIINGRETRDFLREVGVPFEYHEYPMGHQVSEESFADIDRWLTDRLNAMPTSGTGF